VAQNVPQQKHNYLDILSVFHYVNGGLAMILALAALGFLGIGLGGATDWGDRWQPEAGCSIIAIMILILILVGGYAVLNLLTGRAIQTRRGYVLCLLTSAVNCLNMPIGTLLGVFTLVLLADPEVRPLFDGQGAASGGK
jgi:hypothetical protein